jgi:hypothetical protein
VPGVERPVAEAVRNLRKGWQVVFGPGAPVPGVERPVAEAARNLRKG